MNHLEPKKEIPLILSDYWETTGKLPSQHAQDTRVASGNPGKWPGEWSIVPTKEWQVWRERRFQWRGSNIKVAPWSKRAQFQTSKRACGAKSIHKPHVNVGSPKTSARPGGKGVTGEQSLKIWTLCHGWRFNQSFLKEIQVVVLPLKFRISQITVHDNNTDPRDNLQAHINSLIGSGCNRRNSMSPLPETLRGLAADCFYSLNPGSIMRCLTWSKGIRSHCIGGIKGL